MNVKVETPESDTFVEVGQCRTFGEYGPPYQIRSLHGDQANIVVLESGETLDYPVAEILADPLAA